ncbi:glutamate--cysteine ligase [Paeniglutamicibacter sp.]|uniref:carboxylate-amine ligase n=1 Tax=Paeniglutamicibacter sp. TaxID=1934391 RepID=UPI0039894C92
MNTFGIEEEFFLLDPTSGLPAVPDAKARATLMSIRAGGSRSQHELLGCQLEMATPVCTNAKEALVSLRGFRRGLATTAAGIDLQVVSMGTAPLIPDGPAHISPLERYREIHRYLPGISSEQYVSGLHVHIAIPDSEAGILALNGLRRWLPLLVAIGANSPFWRGEDTGFASWRSIHYRKWSVQGIQPYFADADDYYKRLALVLGSDAVLDAGHIGWAARLSCNYPTVEIRVADAQLRAEDSVTLALVIRALVETSIHAPHRETGLHNEMLDLAFWQAAKHGLGGNQLDPETGHAIPVQHMLGALAERIRDALAENGDSDLVDATLERLPRDGNGARRQRESLARGGLARVIADAATDLTA